MNRDRERIRQELYRIIQKELDLTRELTDEEVAEVIDREILAWNSREYLLLEEKLSLQKELFNSIRRLDLLQELIEDPEITEITPLKR